MENIKTRWYKKAVIYQIYPFSFMDSNGDGWGDLKGVLSKLDYLKDLGVDCIWFSPLYESPNHDYGYDVSDYYKISHLFGDNEIFKDFVDKVHSKGMKVMMDMVVNHSSSENEWFKSANSDKNSPYRDYYIFKKGIKKGKKLLPPNNWDSIFTGSAWEKDNATDDEFYLHLFDVHQPDLNWENPKLREEVINIYKYWCDLGVDGFRLDVCNVYSKDQRYLNDKGFLSKGKKYYVDGPRIHEFYKELNEKVFSKYDLTIIGESYDPSIENKKLYVSEKENEMDMIFDFSHFKANTRLGLTYLKKKFDLRVWRKGLIEPQIFNYGNGWNALVIENHDNPRSMSRFGFNSKDYPYEVATMLPLSVFFGFGTPFIYEGEEIGMRDAHFEYDEFRDPVINFVHDRYLKKIPLGEKWRLKILNNGGRDNARTPMQWDDSPNAGFTTGTPWIKVNENYKEINVKNDLSSDRSIYKFYQRLLSLKKHDQILLNGTIKDLCPNNKKVFAYDRCLDKRHDLIISNYTDKTIKYSLPDEMKNYSYMLYLSNYENSKIENGSITLRPYEACVFGWNEGIKEYSYGAVVYRDRNGKREYLVEVMGRGHISLPKGHINEGETEVECARREIKEEVGLEVLIDDKFRRTITYYPQPGVLKDVTFFSAKALSEEIKVDNLEVKDALWMSYNDAYSHLTHESDKETLRLCDEYLGGK